MSNIELAPQFIQEINWEQFKEQRQILIDLSTGTMEGDNGHIIKFMPYDQDRIDGLISLCDAIVDYAIDFCGLPEEDVLLTNDD